MLGRAVRLLWHEAMTLERFAVEMRMTEEEIEERAHMLVGFVFAAKVADSYVLFARGTPSESFHAVRIGAGAGRVRLTSHAGKRLKNRAALVLPEVAHAPMER
jgi:hypothetical protein